MSDKITLTQKEVGLRSLDIPSISSQFSKNDYFQSAATKMNMSIDQLTQFLWDKYHPSTFWMVVTAIGSIAAVMLYIYDRLILKSGKQPSQVQ